MWLKRAIPNVVEVWVGDKPDDPRWRLQFPAVRALRRRLLTRCAWCGGRSHKGDAVNHALQSHLERGPWWRGERNLYHGDCSSIAHARVVCVCGPTGGPWEHVMAGYAYGRCASCGKYRGWIAPEKRTPDYPGLHSDRLLAAIPDGQRDPATMAVVRDLWAHYRGDR